MKLWGSMQMRIHSLSLLSPLLLFCSVAFSTSYATERVQVDPYIKAGPGYTAATGSVTGYIPTKSNDQLLMEASRKGWLGSGATKTPVTVKPKVSIPVGGLAGKVKAGLKTNLGQVALGVAISAAVAGVDWVMSDDNTKIQKKSPSLSDGTPLASTGNTINPQSVCTTYPASQVLGKIITTTYQNVTYAVATFPRNPVSGGSSVWTGPSGYTLYVQNCTSSALGYVHNGGAWPSSFAKVIAIGDIKFNKTDLTDSDWPKLDPWIAGQSADWLKQLLTEACGGTFGTLDPQACYDDLQKQSKAIITGPTKVSGPSSSSSGTYTKQDGTTGTRTTTQNTNYNIRYGDNYFDYDTEVNSKVTEDGQTVSDETTSDATDPAQNPEEKPEEEKEPERLVSGEECSQGLSCSGDAIDCASLRQEKAIRCSFDWPTQQASVLSEVSKPDYKLQEKQIDASTLFTGPSAGRWITGSCPADKSYYSSVAKRSFTVSWSLFCQFASGISVMLVGMASLFFAVYVGRAFGGN